MAVCAVADLAEENSGVGMWVAHANIALADYEVFDFARLILDYDLCQRTVWYFVHLFRVYGG